MSVSQRAVVIGGVLATFLLIGGIVFYGSQPDYAVLFSDLKAADAQAIVTHIKTGKGTVGALVMDEEIYDDMQEMVRDLKHNPWKFLWRE